MNFSSLESMQILCQTHMNIRQMAVMSVVYSDYESKDFGHIKKTLKITGGALSRALTFLLIKKMIRSERNQEDRRRIYIVRTREGEDFVQMINR